MVLRTARKGQKIGSQFWGCSGYPECKATLPVKRAHSRSPNTFRSKDGNKLCADVSLGPRAWTQL